MEDKLTYDVIWQVYQKERQTNQLYPLQKDFYEEAEKIMKERDTDDPEKSRNIKTNLDKIIAKIKERRLQKILLYIAYNKPIQQPIPTPELALYNKITSTIHEDTKIQEKILEEKPAMLSALQNIPEIFLPSGNKIGPLSKQDKVKIENKKDAGFLVDNMLCEYCET